MWLIVWDSRMAMAMAMTRKSWRDWRERLYDEPTDSETQSKLTATDMTDALSNIIHTVSPSHQSGTLKSVILISLDKITDQISWLCNASSLFYKVLFFTSLIQASVIWLWFNMANPRSLGCTASSSLTQLNPHNLLY